MNITLIVHHFFNNKSIIIIIFHIVKVDHLLQVYNINSNKYVLV